MTSFKARSSNSRTTYERNLSSLPYPPMTTESKRTSPLDIPRFTPANYGSFFLAGQFLL